MCNSKNDLFRSALCLILVLAGVFSECTLQAAEIVFPPLEEASIFPSGFYSNQWTGQIFRELLPPQEVKRIILVDKISAWESPPGISASAVYERLLTSLENSDARSQPVALADNEGMGLSFALITSSGGVVQLECLRSIPSQITGVLAGSNGVSVRFSTESFQSSSIGKLDVSKTKRLLPSIETNYVGYQSPGDWAGKRFRDIIQPARLKKMVLLEEDMTMFNRFVEDPELKQKLLKQYTYDPRFDPPPAVAAAVVKQEHRLSYAKLLESFGASKSKTVQIKTTNDETPLARLILLTDSGEVIYLEIIGLLEKRISGVLIHGAGKGVRINLDLQGRDTSQNK